MQLSEIQNQFQREGYVELQKNINYDQPVDNKKISEQSCLIKDDFFANNNTSLQNWRGRAHQDLDEKLEKLTLEEKPPILMLPVDILLEIIRCLDKNGFKNIGLTCKKMLQFRGNYLLYNPSLFNTIIKNYDYRKAHSASLHVSPLPSISSLVDQIKEIAPRVKNINLANSNITDTDLKVIIKLFPNLEELYIDGCDNISNDGLHDLKQLNNLRYLDISGTYKISDEGVEYLRELQHLQYLNLSWSTITDKGVQHLEKLQNIRHLSLAWCYNITNTDLQHLQKLQKLQYINLKGCLKITDEGITYLQKLQDLQYLDLTLCSITDKGVQCLQTLQKLQHLTLNWCSKITNTNLSQLQSLFGSAVTIVT